MTFRTVWQVVMVLMGIMIFWWSVRGRVEDMPRLRTHWWLLGLIVLWIGDAAVGENRPISERVVKGLLAALVGGSFVVGSWRRRRLTREPRATD